MVPVYGRYSKILEAADNGKIVRQGSAPKANMSGPFIVQKMMVALVKEARYFISSIPWGNLM